MTADYFTAHLCRFADGLYSDTHRVTYGKEERVIEPSFFIARRPTTHQSPSEEERHRRRSR
jgi:hypothetical protein